MLKNSKRNKSFIHSFKRDAKIPENISHYISYSLEHDIRPSILTKGTNRSEVSVEEYGQRAGQNTNQAKMFSKQSVWFAGASSKQYDFLSELSRN